MRVSYGPAAVKEESCLLCHCVEVSSAKAVIASCGKVDRVMMPESEDLPFTRENPLITEYNRCLTQFGAENCRFFVYLLDV